MARGERRRVALGLTVRIGRAWVVAVGGPVAAPEILSKTHIQVADTFEEGAVYHTGQELPVEKARNLVRDSERTFVDRARAALQSVTSDLDAKVVAAAVVAGPPKKLPPLETILKAHPMVHAAEGELYRNVFIEAVAAVGPRPRRVAGEALDKTAAATLKLTPAKLAAQLASIGKASGRPWAAEQKQAALAAWLALAAS